MARPFLRLWPPPVCWQYQGAMPFACKRPPPCAHLMQNVRYLDLHLKNTARITEALSQTDMLVRWGGKAGQMGAA